MASAGSDMGDRVGSDTGDRLKFRRTHAQGYVQRTTALSAQLHAHPKFSHLARYLLEEYAFGGLSASQVQMISHVATQDGLSHPSADQLASFGAGGKHAANIDRDLRRYMK